MSTQYPDLTLTNFPSSVDQFMTFLNVVASDGPLIAQYQAAMEAGNTTQANQILAQIPQSTQKIITAATLNQLSQAMLAIERFFLEDIEPYIQNQQQSWLTTINQFSYQGVWASGTSYVTNNLVSYTVSGLNLIYIATSNPPVGTAPSNTQYWRVLTIQGQQGASGTGLSYRQEWSNSTTYNVNDAVTYDGAIYMAIQTNQNREPSLNDQYWTLIMSLQNVSYPIQDTVPTNLQVNGLWFNTQENPTPYYYLEPLTNPITEEMVPVGYQTYTTNGVVLDGTGPLPISSGGTGSSTPQAALSALGAGVRPNLLDNAYFVGGGSQQGGGQMPINQVGDTSWTSSLSYLALFDRWIGYYSSGGVTFSLTSAGVVVPATSAYTTILQRLLQPNSSMAGKTYTASAIVDGELISATGEVTAASQGGTSTFITATGSNGCRVRLQYSSTNGMYFDVSSPDGGFTVECCKLEEGEGQTLAYQDSTGAWHRLPQPEDGDYAGQLAKCQAYQVVINTLDVSGVSNNATILQANIPTPVTMRALPAIENNGVFSVRGSGTNQINLTATTYSVSLNANGIRVGIAGQFTNNEPYQVSITSPIILNANL